MSKDLSNVLFRIENQLNQRGIQSQRNMYESFSNFKNLNYKPNFSAKTEGNEEKTETENDYLSQTLKPNISNLFSSRRPQAIQEQETKTLINQELEPYIDSIRKQYEKSLTNIKQELNEHTNILKDLQSIKEISNNNQIKIAHLEKEIENLKHNNNNNIPQRSDYNSNNFIDNNQVKQDINELNNYVNQLNEKYEELNKELQQNNNKIATYLTQVIQENETKLNNELNTLKNQLNNEHKQSVEIPEPNQDNINELREDFKDEIDKIYNEIQVIKESKNKNYMNLNINNEFLEQFKERISSLENQIENNTIQISNIDELKNQIIEMKNEQDQLRLQINTLMSKNPDEIQNNSGTENARISQFPVQNDNYLNKEFEKLKQQVDVNTDQLKDFNVYCNLVEKLNQKIEIVEKLVFQLHTNLGSLLEKFQEENERQKNFENYISNKLKNFDQTYGTRNQE